MFSLDKKEDPDRLSCVFGNSVVKPQAPHILHEDAEPQELPESYLTETLCLSRTKLRYVAESIVKNSTLKYLYLEGNHISTIPDSLFISLPRLLWLDLRNNQIASLPAKIGLHRSLETLLLEGNPISELPPELGHVITLRGLNLRDCPILFPPQDIVHQGLQIILQYLRSTMAKRPFSMRQTPPGAVCHQAVSGSYHCEKTALQERLLLLQTSQTPQSQHLSPCLQEFPVVEKLQLSELLGSSVEEQDESVDENQLQRFRELKEKMILLDKAELGLIPQSGRNPKSRLPPINKRKKANTKAVMIPELPLFDTQQWKRPEERRQSPKKERQALLEKQKSKEARQMCCTRAKITQEKKISEDKRREHERQRKGDEAETDSKPGVENSNDTPQSEAPGMSITEYEDRSAPDLERQIRAHVEKMQEQCRNPRGMTTEQMAVVEKDVKEMKKLQARLLERKRHRGRILENSFTIFTGDTWKSFLYN